MRYGFYIFVFCALLANSYYVGQFSDVDKLSGYTPILLAICVTTAVFAINFSFYQYQVSPYKEIRRQLSPVHSRLSLVVFVLSILPMLSLVYLPDYSTILAISLVPSVGVLGFILLVVAKKEVDIINIITKQTKRKRINQFFASFCFQIDKKLSEIENVQLSELHDTPMHEWEWTIPPSQPSDSPLRLIESANSLAVRNKDIDAFSEILARTFDLVEMAYQYKPKGNTNDDYKITRVLNNETGSFVRRICIDAISDDKSCSFSKQIVSRASNRLVTLASHNKQTSDFSFLLLSLLNMVATHCYEKDQSEIALGLVSLSRKIVNKGLDRVKSDDIEFSQYQHLLPQLTYHIVQMGSLAIKKESSETLYRCLDAYGWLGCAAVKKRNYNVALKCLRSLAQLGREARAVNLECFWSRCSITPWGHAEERIGWIFSWLAKMDEKEREIWLSAVKEAYQRLLGFQVELKIEQNEGKANLNIMKKKEKHTITYMDHGHERTIDYSDYSFLKDMEMY